jgi:hypothetical protein
MGTVRIWLVGLVLALIPAAAATGRAQAVRHHFYVGTITAITFPNRGHAGSLIIHSKTHNTNFHFVIDNSTRFLRRGQGEPRTSFKVGSYVTVSYSPGPNGTMIAYHISLRR